MANSCYNQTALHGCNSTAHIRLQQHYITDAPTCTPVHHMLDYTYNLFLCLSLSLLLSHTQTHTHNWTEGEYFEQVI